MKKLINLCLTSCVLSLTGVAAHSDVYVIVHPSNTSELDKKIIKKIYLGKSRKFDSGGRAVPFALSDDNETTKEFNKEVLNKSSAQLKSYWSKLIFTGKGAPPKAFDRDEDVIEAVRNNPNAIGYISKMDGTDGTRVVDSFSKK